MPSLLHLDSSADLQHSTSRALTAHFADVWHARGPEYTVVRRDLHRDPLPHLPTNALHWAPRLRVAGEVADPAAEGLQKALIDEVLAADAIVIGAPMYQWTVPSTLKAWLDYLHVPGVTNTYDVPTQPFKGKPAIVVCSRGDSYGADTANAGLDYVTPVLTQVLGVALGMNVSFVVAELTLAQRIPAMAEFIDAQKASYASAVEALTALANA
jgi:FMN-dependent NADH-azoreductase